MTRQCYRRLVCVCVCVCAHVHVCMCMCAPACVSFRTEFYNDQMFTGLKEYCISTPLQVFVIFNLSAYLYFVFCLQITKTRRGSIPVIYFKYIALIFIFADASRKYCFVCLDYNTIKLPSLLFLFLQFTIS